MTSRGKWRAAGPFERPEYEGVPKATKCAGEASNGIRNFCKYYGVYILIEANAESKQH